MMATQLLVLLAVIAHTAAYSNFKRVHGVTLMEFPFQSTGLYSSIVSESTVDVVSGSSGVELLKDYLNSDAAAAFVKKLVLLDKKVAVESEKLNFWTGESFTVKSCICTGVIEKGLTFMANCDIKGKATQRNALVEFPSPVKDEYMLKRVLVQMAGVNGKIKNTADIAKLKFGEDCSVPSDLLFNDVPHPAWVRSYMYESVSTAVRRVVNEKNTDLLRSEEIDKSRMQIKVNFPEVNPAFDTYRIGTILELVRHITLALTVEEGKRVRICVQQALGEGIFVGLPLSLASMRIVLDRMDWGGALTEEEKARPSDVDTPRKEALIRLGCVGSKEVQEDDDVIIIIAPQNVIGGMLIDSLDEMVKAARGKPVIILNPSLGDRPSSNNVMQIRGRSERKAIENSFKDIYVLKLLYPSSGGYMFPIKGLVLKKSFDNLYCVYLKEMNNGREEYNIVAAFPSHPAPSTDTISSIFTDRNR